MNIEEKDIIQFSQELRKNRVPASIRSTQTAVESMPYLDEIQDLGLLQDTLELIYVKDQSQKAAFNKVYKDLFHEESEEEKSVDEKKDKESKKKLWTSKARPPKVNYRLKSQKTREVQIKAPKTLSEVDADLNLPYNDEFIDQHLMDRDINSLDFFSPELINLCQKLGKKVANKRNRRYRHSKTRKIDIGRTIRKNLRYGGTLLELQKKKPQIRKNKHYFLCDVSGSCDWITNWFFCMVYSSQKSFYQSRFFDFDNKTLETTLALREENIQSAFLKIREMRIRAGMVHGISNMDLAFTSFLKQAKLNNKSIILILTDCRDWAGPKKEGKPTSADLLEEMVDKSKKVVILNPEPKLKWNVVDSAVQEYQDAGAIVKEVRNLRQLAELIEYL